MTETRKTITPEMKVAELLEVYPELETTLVELSAAFSKLKNPVLRRTVARVTSLRQAAVVGGVDLGLLINTLRRAAGVAAQYEPVEEQQALEAERPSWWDEASIVLRYDARPVLEAGEKPLSRVMNDFGRLPEGRIYELTTPFVPAPLIDLGKARGLEVWWKQPASNEVRTYFYHPQSPDQAGSGPLVLLE